MNLRPFGEDTTEGADNGESFLSWINESEKEAPPVKQQQVAAVTNSITTLFPAGPPAPEPPKHQMVIITPAGSKTYIWNDDTDLPKESDSTTQPDYPNNAGGVPSNQFSASIPNVNSGYGGYTPTYPTSAVPTGSASTPAAGKSPVN